VEKGGTLDLIRRTLAIRCLPGDIPDKLEVDVTDLDLGDVLHVADLIGVLTFEVADDKSLPVAMVSSPEGAGAEAGAEGAD
jgi:large subunit ribosomal protein L25